MARCSVLHEVTGVVLTAGQQQKLEHHVAILRPRSYSLPLAVWRAAQLAQAVARAAEAERRQVEGRGEECRSRGSWASQALSLQIQHSQTSARSHMVHARTQTPVRFPGQISVGAQAPSSQEAAATAKQQQQQRQANSSKNALKREPMMLWCHCLCVLLLRQKRHRGQHPSTRSS